jgi:hypothetical protein
MNRRTVMSDPLQQPDKKIIVDEDWKKQVEAERAAEHSSESAAAPAAAPPEAEERLPPPSLVYLASSLYIQAAIALGLLPHPVSGKAEVHRNLAKHAIDTLEILQQKTEGNRTPEETDEIEAMLHQLHMAYVGA